MYDKFDKNLHNHMETVYRRWVRLKKSEKKYITLKINKRLTWNFTHFKKNVLNLFVCIKLIFFLTIFLSLSDLYPWWIKYNKNRHRLPRIKF